MKIWYLHGNYSWNISFATKPCGYECSTQRKKIFSYNTVVANESCQFGRWRHYRAYKRGRLSMRTKNVECQGWTTSRVWFKTSKTTSHYLFF